MEKLSWLFLVIITLCGCAQQPSVVNNVPAVQEKQVVQQKDKEAVGQVVMGEKNFIVPTGYIATHTPVTAIVTGVDYDNYYFKKQDAAYDCAYLRIGHLTNPISELNLAQVAFEEYNKGAFYNAYDDNIVSTGALLQDSIYYQCSLITANDGWSYLVFSFINKGSSDIYSAIFLYDAQDVTDCDMPLFSSCLNGLQQFSASSFPDLYFYNVLSDFSAKMFYKQPVPVSYNSIPIIPDESQFTLRSNETYALNLSTGVYSIEVMEGSGDVIISDARFGERRFLMGYGSVNAPYVLNGVALINGGTITTELGLSVRILH